MGTNDPYEVGETLTQENSVIKGIIKMGSRGCILCGSGIENPIHMKAMPLDKIGMQVLNTVGCGDAFIGAFAASKVLGHDDFESLRRGCAAGSFKATRIETRGGPSARELEDILKNWESLES